METLLAEGIFRPGDPVVIAESIWCALHGLTAVLMDHVDQAQSSKDELTESVIAMILRGLCSGEPEVLEARAGSQAPCGQAAGGG